ncbi:MAG TPA: hypothetical protein VMY34_09870 [Acidimicrobiales bacterium]|nr:hypothetical protein [Acidimicrobiales bacterium]
MKKLVLIAAAIAMSIPVSAAMAQDAFRCQSVAAGIGSDYVSSGCVVSLDAGVRTLDLTWSPNSVGQMNLGLVDAAGTQVGTFYCSVLGLDVRDCGSTGQLANGSSSIDTIKVTGGQISVVSELLQPATLTFTVSSAALDPEPSSPAAGVYAAEGAFELRGQ